MQMKRQQKYALLTASGGERAITSGGELVSGNEQKKVDGGRSHAA